MTAEELFQKIQFELSRRRSYEERRKLAIRVIGASLERQRYEILRGVLTEIAEKIRNQEGWQEAWGKCIDNEAGCDRLDAFSTYHNIADWVEAFIPQEPPLTPPRR